MTPSRSLLSALLLAAAAAVAGCTLELIDHDAPPTAQPGCGNGVVEAGEVCDDGNQVGGDGCAPLCDSTEVCGNGILDAHLGEQCDTGGAVNAACDVDCTAAACGDGFLNPAAGEVCDDGNTLDADGCRSDCRSTEICGNGILDHHLPKNGSTHPECRDPTLQGTGCAEHCDDGNHVAGDGCSANCLSTEVCGNHIVDVGEECDDGNQVPADGCDPDCTLHSTPACGNHVIDPGEQCDAGGVATATCDADCTAPVCGDGYHNLPASEECDPGAVGVPTATCDANCTFALCGDAYVNPAAGEQCDDGNNVDGDACRNDCTLP